MSTVLITYRVLAKHVGEHLALLDMVHDELRRVGPAEVSWTTYRQDDGRSFVELVRTDEPGRFSALDSWPAFRQTLEHRCDQPPEVIDLKLVAGTGQRPPGDGSSALADIDKEEA